MSILSKIENLYFKYGLKVGSGNKSDEENCRIYFNNLKDLITQIEDAEKATINDFISFYNGMFYKEEAHI